MKNEKLLTGVAVSLGADYVLSTILNRALRKFQQKLAQKLGNKLGQKGVQTLAKTIGKTLTRSLGLQIGKQVAKIAVTQSAKAAAKIAASSSTAAASGPGFPIVFLALLAVDAISISLDMTNAGGYSEESIKSRDIYVQMRDDNLKATKDFFKEEKLNYPLIGGPLDKLSKIKSEIQPEDVSELEVDEEGFAIPRTLYDDEMDKAFDDVVGPYMQKIKTKLENDAKNGKLSEEDTEIFEAGEIPESYMTGFPDEEKINIEVIKKICINNNGKPIIRPGVNDISKYECSFPDKQSCNSSYKWPIVDDKETYVEWRKNIFDKKKDKDKIDGCIVSSTSVRLICESAEFQYDDDEGLCNITEAYCFRKGMEWKNNDCYLDKGQEFAEMIFGTTITRGLKQVFDPKQYNPCKSGERDQGYYCTRINCPTGYESSAVVDAISNAAGSSFIAFTNLIKDKINDAIGEKGDDLKGFSMCYGKCPENYDSVLSVCIEKCPEGSDDIGLFCIPAIKSRDRGVGRPADSTGGQVIGRPCDKYDEICAGDTCLPTGGEITWGNWTPLTMDAKGKISGGWDAELKIGDIDFCGAKTPKTCNRGGCAIDGWGSCPDGYENDGLTCRKKITLSCRDDEELQGLLCYPKCDPGFTGVGPTCFAVSKNAVPLAKDWKSRDQKVGAMSMTPKTRYADYSTKDN